MAANAIRGNSLYALLFRDHPRYENPVYGDLGYATDSRLAWWSWGNSNQNAYRYALFSQATTIGGTIATIDTQTEFAFLDSSFQDSVSFGAWIYLPGGALGAANFRKEFYVDYKSSPDYQGWSTGDNYSGYAPEYAVAEIPLNLSITRSSTPKDHIYQPFSRHPKQYYRWCHSLLAYFWHYRRRP